MYAPKGYIGEELSRLHLSKVRFKLTETKVNSRDMHNTLPFKLEYPSGGVGVGEGWGSSLCVMVVAGALQEAGGRKFKYGQFPGSTGWWESDFVQNVAYLLK